MVFMPMASAQPSSRSMVRSSNVSACHISSSLIAVDGRKSAPTGQGCRAYQVVGLRFGPGLFGPALLRLERGKMPNAITSNNDQRNECIDVHTADAER